MTDLANTHPRKKLNILLIGDVCIDKYYYGRIDRISPEAPVPIFVPETEKTKNGMAFNVYNNLVALGAFVVFKHGDFSKKLRYVESKSKYQVFRIDLDTKKHDAYNHDDTLRDFDCVVISDYNKGYVSYETVREIRRSYKGPIFVDTKKHDLKKFDGCFVKINNHEFSNLTSICSDLIITLGAGGVKYKDKIYTTDSVEVHDVTGAGDVFLASLAYYYALDKDIEDAIKKANKLATRSVQHYGVYTIQESDIKAIND